MFQEKKTAIDLLMVEMVEKNVNKKQEFFLPNN